MLRRTSERPPPGVSARRIPPVQRDLILDVARARRRRTEIEATCASSTSTVPWMISAEGTRLCAISDALGERLHPYHGGAARLRIRRSANPSPPPTSRTSHARGTCRCTSCTIEPVRSQYQKLHTSISAKTSKLLVAVALGHMSIRSAARPDNAGLFIVGKTMNMGHRGRRAGDILGNRTIAVVSAQRLPMAVDSGTSRKPRAHRLRAGGR